jgi:hypothetical protein
MRPLSGQNGHIAMLESLHTIVFPTAGRDHIANIIDQPLAKDNIEALFNKCPSGQVVILPAKARLLIQTEKVAFSDDRWLVISGRESSDR